MNVILKRIITTLVHPAFDLFGGDLMGLDDVDDTAPTGAGVAVDGVGQGLRDALEQLLGAHVLEPKCLTHT